jgi:hypothetical protein
LGCRAKANPLDCQAAELQTARTLATLLLFAATTALAQAPAPDTLSIHGDILTGSHLKPNDPSPTPARVTAVVEGKIVAVGETVYEAPVTNPH